MVHRLAYLMMTLRRNRRAVRFAARLGSLMLLTTAISMLAHVNSNIEFFYSPEEIKWEREIQWDEARIRYQLGAWGEAAELRGAEAKRGAEDVEKRAMNVFLSNLLPYNRSLKDYRFSGCESVQYDAELPSASVIIIFHNEPYSVVVRTLWSIINSVRRTQPWHRNAKFIDKKTGRTMTLGYPGQEPESPLVYLKEIILVDDSSTLKELQGKLKRYIGTRLPPDLVKILRMPDRVGLIRARMEGARIALGDSLVFLDAHCETQPDWLRPLLQRIKEHPHVIAMPIIDILNSTSFQYTVCDNETFMIPGFLFEGYLYYVDVPPWEVRRRGSYIAPTRSPMMAGGLFAMNRAYFFQLGAYDEHMAGWWGGENLEMAFRVWQCGGSLEVMPCSRVGHVGFSVHPYLPQGNDWLGINTARMAEVWMDEYAELIYLYRPHLRNNPQVGDVSQRKALRKRLRCKSFHWYLMHTFREKFVPLRDTIAHGRFKNPLTNLCLNTLPEELSTLRVSTCSSHLWSQVLFLTVAARLRDEVHCVELESDEKDINGSARVTTRGKRLILVDCSERPIQKWRYFPYSQQLQHVESGLCCDAGFAAGAEVLAKPCRRAGPSQKWHVDYFEKTEQRNPDKNLNPIQRINMLKIRSHRRNYSQESLGTFVVDTF